MKQIAKFNIFICFFVTFMLVNSFTLSIMAQDQDLEDMDLADLLEIPLSYGFNESKVETHIFMNTALWNLEKQSLGSTANSEGTYAGRPLFITYSGYIDISCQITKTLFAEAEFELYKGEKGQFKVTKLRQVWSPSEYFRLTLGRDFPPIGIQDLVYYPPSQYRLFTIAPYLYWSILRATGWWDSGIYTTFILPFSFMDEKASVKIDLGIINGPGDEHQDDNYLVGKMKPNSEGFMFEGFHNKARQPWDNNKNKFIPVRLSVNLLNKFNFGASYMEGRYTKDEYGEKLAQYVFGHFLYGGDRLTIAAEFGQLKIGVDPENMKVTGVNDINNTEGDKYVTQKSYYLSAGYKVIKDKFNIYYLEPVVRYEFMDSWVEDDKNKGDRNVVWAGIRLSPVKNWTLKLAYCFQSEPGLTDLNEDELENNGLTIESVIEF